MTGFDALVWDPREPVEEGPAGAGRGGELLELQRMESAVVRADLAHPGAIPPRDVERLRYLLSLARVERFEPGAALTGRSSGRPEVDVKEAVAPLRARVLRELREPLRDAPDPVKRLKRAADLLTEIGPDVPGARTRALTDAPSLTPAELDAEAGRRVLVSVAGGGGGAGYVYLGAYHALEKAGIVPGFVIGSSMGAILGAFRARARQAPWDQLMAVAKNVDRRELFTPVSLVRRFGMPGLLALKLRGPLGAALSDGDGVPLRIDELEIPYAAVVAGVRARSYERLPARFRREATVPPKAVAPRTRFSLPRLPSALATRMWQVAAFFDPRMVKAVVLGADPNTAGLNAIDAAGFSASIPGVLHYEPSPDDARTTELLTQLFADQEVAALVDGGVASNVPTDHAWELVRGGLIGTRNVFVLAFDCFHPQWEPGHLWLQPITQAVQLQMQRNAPFADWIIRFERTLSPVNLVPTPERLDEAIAWGEAAIDEALPLIRKFLEPVSWD